MKIGIISFLSDAQFEDAVIETLICDELPDLFLEFRAISTESLMERLQSISTDGIRRLVIHDLAKIDINDQIQRLGNLISLQVESSNPIKVREEVFRTLRAFETRTESARKIVKRSNLIVVTGTTGSPGITTLTLNLAHELSLEMPINLLDVDQRRNDLAFMLGGRRDADATRLNDRITISRTELVDFGMNLADCGSAPDLNTAISDRRAVTRKFSDLIEAATKIVFVTQPENNVMFELERFIEAHQSRIITAEPIFLVNKLGDSQRQRSISRRCQARAGANLLLNAPLDIASLERAKAQYAPLAEVAPRSRIRRSIRELATHLIQ